MTRDELRHLIQGPIATVPTPFDDNFEVDISRMASATDYWVANGVVTGKGIIKVAAAMGEGPMLRDDEWPALLRTVVQASHGKATVVGCVHYKDTKRTIEDVKRMQDLGAVGVQITPPIFNLPTQDDHLRYFESVSHAVDIGIIVYHQPWVPHGEIATDTYLKMADFEHVVAIKWYAQDDERYDEMKQFAHIFNVIDNGGKIARCHQLGGRGYVNWTEAAWPPHDIHIWDLLEQKKYDEAQALHDPPNEQLYAFDAKVSQKSGGQGRVIKGMMEIMGQPMGASRPPSMPLDNANMAELRQMMIGWDWPVMR